MGEDDEEEPLLDDLLDNLCDEMASPSATLIFRVYCCLVMVQVINAGYNTLTHDAIHKGGVNPLVFSLYRDTMAYPILQLASLLSRQFWVFLLFLKFSCRLKKM